MRNIYGDISSTRTHVSAFSLGAVTLSNLPLQIDADTVTVEPFAGLISNDLLTRYDVDIDFGSHRLNLFLPTRCSEQGIYWKTEPVAIIPFKILDSHITLPVTLDGHPMTAIIDTGAPYTTLNADMARYFFDLKPGAPGMSPPNEIPHGGKTVAVYTHSFSVMNLNGVTVYNPAMLIVPMHIDPTDHDPQSHLPRRTFLPDVIVGMDILETLHIYIAYRDRQLYVSPADKIAANLLPPVSPANP